LPPILGDRDRLQQVVWNLLSNGVKFTDRGGMVEVRLFRDAQHLTLTVSDTGRGIEPEFLPHVFDLFSQAGAAGTKRHAGLGLGLALVKQLVELHGGTVKADSAGTGRGTILTIALPVPGSMQVTRAAVTRRGPLTGLTILAVDDTADARDLLQAQLEGQGATVIVAESSEAAIAWLEHARGPEAPAVIVADLAMPREDGFAFIRRVRGLARGEGGRIPAIALTGYAGAESRTVALHVGYDAYLVKPFDIERLVAAIVALVNRPPSPEAAAER
jgi:CheY-like chemotaxis protein